MSDIKKKVDESWKEQAAREKKNEDPALSPAAAQSAPVQPEQEAPTHDHADQVPEVGPEAGPEAGAEAGQMPPARFDLFVSSLAMEALMALGDVPHPVTQKVHQNLAHAKYSIDLLAVLEEKTQGNLSADEEKLLKDSLYQLRMRYLQKSEQ